MNKTWFTSDLHFCHDREFIYRPRGFNSIHEMNETIIKNFNEVMDWADELYILGDCFLNNNEEGAKFLSRLPGMKYVVWGNHDTDARKVIMEDMGINILGFAHQQKFNNISFYLSHYPSCTSNFDDDKPLKARTICLAGHTHSKEKWDETGSYNVALDAHNCYPVLLDDIIKDVKEKLKCK